jgi:hypothetical protein
LPIIPGSCTPVNEPLRRAPSLDRDLVLARQGDHPERKDVRSSEHEITSCRDFSETNANEPPITHRNTTRTTSGPELPPRAGRSTQATYLLAVRCPVYRGRDSSLGFRTELENLVCDGKGKGTSGSPVRRKVPRRRPGADCSIGALIRGNSPRSKGSWPPVLIRVNGKPEELEVEGRRQSSVGGTSRLS